MQKQHHACAVISVLFLHPLKKTGIFVSVLNNHPGKCSTNICSQIISVTTAGRISRWSQSAAAKVCLYASLQWKSLPLVPQETED